MKIFDDLQDPDVAKRLRAGEVGVIRTDTLYGLVSIAADQGAVERIFTLKSRDDIKSPIVLVSSSNQLFDSPSEFEKIVIDKVWPGKTSVILRSKSAPSWIERGHNTVAYRLPNVEKLQKLISQTGPLIAPSANPQGQSPAENIQEAEEYFGNTVDFYVDGGSVINAEASALIRPLDGGEVERLR